MWIILVICLFLLSYSDVFWETHYWDIPQTVTSTQHLPSRLAPKGCTDCGDATCKVEIRIECPSWLHYGVHPRSAVPVLRLPAGLLCWKLDMLAGREQVTFSTSLTSPPLQLCPNCLIFCHKHSIHQSSSLMLDIIIRTGSSYLKTLYQVIGQDDTLHITYDYM